MYNEQCPFSRTLFTSLKIRKIPVLCKYHLHKPAFVFILLPSWKLSVPVSGTQSPLEFSYRKIVDTEEQNPQTILVVEHDPMQQVILSKTLGTHGYEVIVAENGRSGLEKARSLQPRVLITDWMMPEMDGSELCRRIKQDADLRYTYVIILTAKEGKDAKIQGFDSGADDYLVKPFQFDELVARVRVGFRIRGLQEELAGLQHQLAVVELARTMGHEINNPLAILKGYLELAEIHLRKNPDETLQRQFALIKSAAEKIQLVVERLQHIRRPANTEYIRGMNMVDLWDLDKGDEKKEN